jgi:hypothetical protein
MSFYIGGKETEIDLISQPENLLAAAPRYKQNLEVVKDIRHMQAECARIEQNMVSTGTFRSKKDGFGCKQIAAGIPWSIWATAAEKDPTFWTNRKNAYRWLARHPEYRTGRTIIKG